MKEVIAQEVVRRIVSEVFTPKQMEESEGLSLRLYSPRTEAEIAECAELAIQLSKKALKTL